MTRIVSVRRIPQARRSLRLLASLLSLAGAKFANRVLPGYMNYMGSKYEIIVDHDGPASYNNTGTFATSGEVLNAIDFGLGGFEMADAQSLSSDGLNYCWILLTGQSTSADVAGNAVPTIRVYWYVAATNAQVANAANMSGKSIRLQIRGV
jgi:hypothetical protein